MIFVMKTLLLVLTLFSVVGCNRDSRNVSKDGRCPDQGEDEIGICANECRNDLSCDGAMKCCRTSCGGYTCAQPVEEIICRIPCPRIFDPVCGSDGQTYSNDCILNYTTCTRNQQFVHMVHFGSCQEEPSNTRENEADGPCEYAKVKAVGPNEIPMIGTKIPQCDDEGYYQAMQCWGSVGMCWCVDRQGNEISEPKRGKLTMEDCLTMRASLQQSP